MDCKMLAPRCMDPATHHLHLEPHDYHAPPISRTIQYKKVSDRHSIGDQEVPCFIGTRRWQRGQKVFHETTPHSCTMFPVYVRWNVITHRSEFSVTLSNFLIFAMHATGLANLILVLVYQKMSQVLWRSFECNFSCLIFYLELSRMEICGHGYEPHGLLTRLTVCGPRGWVSDCQNFARLYSVRTTCR
jgi:hypothetical protein